jgi:hypothetical protein
MPDLEQRIAEWRLEMSRAGIKRPEVLDELEAHLRDQLHQFKPELGEAAAFDAAVKQLGDSKILKREFAKVNRFRSWLPRDNPILLNLLAVWFIYHGLQSLDVFLRGGISRYSPIPASPFQLSIRALFALRILLGIGLIRRRNFWRYVAFGFLFFSLYSLRLINPLPWWNKNSYDDFLGLTIPTRFTIWFPWINLGIAICGILYLTTPSVRNLFRVGAKTKTA